MTEQQTAATKTALVTGASRGIGRAIAEALAAEGYRLYLTCRHSEAELTQLSYRLSETFSVPCTPILADMGNERDVERVFSEIKELTVLVNNAGVSHVGLLHEMSVEQWQSLMDVNLNALFYTCRLAIPLMLRRHAGKILNISSIWGNVGASMEVAYSASKGGVNAFTKALAKELAPSGIQVNAIACGLIDTEMNRHLSEDDLQQLVAEIPADRIGQPEEAARLVLSLLDAPDYLTGQIITLDGGWSA
ncbi:MAG: SDR family NAD(P)-dependent oxidoreductase [bacterium]|nr:SDR family NAD(P)-dependent oxidoreductase [bacterium]MCM1422926.1 SDR family NAD(P)-dependent oxidoreductase [bacterium]